MDSAPAQKWSRNRKTTQSLASVTRSEIQKGAERLTKGRSTKRAYSTLFALVAIPVFCLSILLFYSSAPAAATANTLESSQLLFPRQANNSATANAAPSNQTQCGFTGDSDTYGYGIRIGVYLQWMTSSIAYAFVPEEALTMGGVNNCFQAAMFAGLIYITKKPRAPDQPLHAVEAFVMLLLGFGGFFVGNLYEKDEKMGARGILSKAYVNFRATTWGGLFSLSLGLGFCTYGIWFAFRGMDTIQPEPCSTFAFFFTKVGLYGRYRTFLKVIFLLGTLLCTIFAIMSCVMRESRTAGKKEYQKYNLINISFGGCLIIFIIAVELTIKWNSITGVSTIGSTGQLLPIILGGWGAFRVLRQFMITFLISLAKQK